MKLQPTHKLTVEEAAEFLYGGKALFTIKSTTTGKHITFKVARGYDKASNLFFVRVFTGSGFRYVGFVNEREPNKLVKGNHGMEEHTDSFRVADWVFRHLGGKEKNLKGAEFWHHGICGCCGRPLTDPESIKLGIGPVCRGNLAKRAQTAVLAI